MMATRFDHTALMHGRDYSGQECSGWLAQRKWNGVFAGWDGERLFTKSGNTIEAPAFFTEGLPDFPLCCELVAEKEGDTHATALINRRAKTLVQRAERDDEWRKARLHVFDAPEVEVPKLWGANNVAHRLEAVAGQVLDARHAEMVRTFPLRDREHLLAELRAVLAAGGEGLMIQPPELAYTAGRTSRLLKVKRQSLHYFDHLRA